MTINAFITRAVVRYTGFDKHSAWFLCAYETSADPGTVAMISDGDSAGLWTEGNADRIRELECMERDEGISRYPVWKLYIEMLCTVHCQNLKISGRMYSRLLHFLSSDGHKLCSKTVWAAYTGSVPTNHWTSKVTDLTFLLYSARQ